MSQRLASVLQMPLKPRTSILRQFVCPRCQQHLTRPQRPRIRTFATSSRLSSPPARSRKYAQLRDRTIIKLAGPDAAVFLNGLIPAKILDIENSEPIYTVFLSPQGRILNDVFIYPPVDGRPDVWFVEVDTNSASDLMKHLRKHKLRSKFQLERVDPALMSVFYHWPSDDTLEESGAQRVGGHDPRPGMGTRWLREPLSQVGAQVTEGEDQSQSTEQASVEEYMVHRMLNGVAEGQAELIASGSLPQESNVDFFGGIDFVKGCYLGQELTIRTHHTGVVRKRILPCQLYDSSDPPASNGDGPAYDAGSSLAQPRSQSNISKLNAKGRGRSSGKWLAGIGNIGLSLCRLEMMTDIQLTADRTNYDPSEEYQVQWEVEGENDKHRVMLKPFVPKWLRDGVEQSLRRKEKKVKPRRREEHDDYDELD